MIKSISESISDILKRGQINEWGKSQYDNLRKGSHALLFKMPHCLIGKVLAGLIAQ